MTETSKVLTVSYGAFSCRLEGFEGSFGALKAICAYFCTLAADEADAGAAPPAPSVDMLQQIASRETRRHVEAHADDDRVILRVSPAREDPSVSYAEDGSPQGGPVASGEEDVERLLDKAGLEMEGRDHLRRRATIEHLKSAFKAIHTANGDIYGQDRTQEQPYREDLAFAKLLPHLNPRSNTPAAEPPAAGESAAGLPQDRQAPGPVRPRHPVSAERHERPAPPAKRLAAASAARETMQRAPIAGDREDRDAGEDTSPETRRINPVRPHRPGTTTEPDI
ncbi:hypothetical protein [Tropicimonas sp.]|uniref:hypothetical protein n=1 Tax=Tropicimonas sp. TaxID=2067044 RepID=UPI003A8930B6